MRLRVWLRRRLQRPPKGSKNLLGLVPQGLGKKDTVVQTQRLRSPGRRCFRLTGFSQSKREALGASSPEDSTRSDLPREEGR